MPPALSFAVRHLHCSSGIVITASHNPRQYNGYKVYGSDGCQITLNAAREILSEINIIDDFRDVCAPAIQELGETDYIKFIDSSVTSAFLSAVTSQSINKDVQNKRNLKIMYTPLNGAGLFCVTSALAQNGYTNFTVVESQKEPDGNFPTYPYPNLEEKDALKEGLKECEKSTADILLSTDPDCDRVGIAVKHKDDYKLLSGNEVGILLFDYICKMRISTNSMPKEPICIKTIVTTDMVLPIAKNYGVSVIEPFYKSMGKTLVDALNDLYEKYGYYMNTLQSFSFEGEYNQNKIRKLMNNLRGRFKLNLGDRTVTSVCDYLTSKQVLTDGTTNETNLPKSNVIKFLFNDGTSVTIRPSGAEPKLKIYTSVVGTSYAHAEKLINEITGYFTKLVINITIR